MTGVNGLLEGGDRSTNVLVGHCDTLCFTLIGGDDTICGGDYSTNKIYGDGQVDAFSVGGGDIITGGRGAQTS